MRTSKVAQARHARPQHLQKLLGLGCTVFKGLRFQASCVRHLGKARGDGQLIDPGSPRLSFFSCRGGRGERHTRAERQPQRQDYARKARKKPYLGPATPPSPNSAPPRD